VLNADGLRYADEFLKHKILDAMGDIYLLGHPLIGDFYGRKSGHALNNVAARALLDDPTAFELVSFDHPAQLPKGFLEPSFSS
jgi:UDP-3-O-[3-hydroxymyristoyl] N-acetylglucosamine deacetylase